MDLKQLAYFVQVVDAGGFTRAAGLLGVDQSIVSRNVRRLEVELRQTLLIRDGRGVMPTEAGRHWLMHSRGILHQVSRARQELEERRGAPVGHIVIGLPPSIGLNLTARLVKDFRRRFPDATIGVVEGLSASLLDHLNTGRIDLALVHNPVPSGQFDFRALLDEPLCLVSRGRSPPGKVSAGRPVPMAELQEMDLIQAGRPNAVRMVLESRMASLGLRLNVTLEVEGIPSVLDLVANGHGHAVLPRATILGVPWKWSLTCRRIVRPAVMTTLALATAARRPVTPLMTSTADLVSDLLRA